MQITSKNPILPYYHQKYDKAAMKQCILFVILFGITFSGHQGYAQEPGSGNQDLPAGDAVTDRDGNEYRTVIIGNQEWMTRNLNTTRFSNGDSIPNVKDSRAWRDLDAPAWAFYNNEDYFENSYGKLYNWYAVNDPRGLCPAGWTVPSNDDWNTLRDYLSRSDTTERLQASLEEAGMHEGMASVGDVLKSTDMQHWQSPNEGATNESGFSALPGGNRSENGTFGGIGNTGLFWSATEADPDLAWMLMLVHRDISSDMLYAHKRHGFSVRCIRSDEDQPVAVHDQVLASVNTIPVTDITQTGAVSGGNITDDGGSPIIEKGIVWDTREDPTLQQHEGVATSGSGTERFQNNLTGLTPGQTYHVRAFAVNRDEIAYGESISFTTSPPRAFRTVTDIDGNEYRVIEIGNQVWMAENLITSRYRNGDDITYVLDNNEWQDLNQSETDAWAFYNNNAGNETYGILYNWYAVNDPRGLCPEGWRVSTDRDWQQLERHLGMSQAEAQSTGWRGETANVGGKLKAAGTDYWRGPNTGANNESGFTALPGGYRFTSGTFSYLSFFGYWWTASEADATTAWRRVIFNNRQSINRMNYDKRYGFSVRCVEN
ncbi:MAG: fibrobacter succinogenes major paralogous domain-containing protein [Bacteroidota bacterium]